MASNFALDSRRHEVDHPPPQLDHQTVQNVRREVLLAHLRWVTGPGSAAEVGQWHGALVPGLAAPLGFQAAFPHQIPRSKVAQGVQQGRCIAFFVAVAQQPGSFHHSIG
jgi:hypothetical protein